MEKEYQHGQYVSRYEQLALRCQARDNQLDMAMAMAPKVDLLLSEQNKLLPDLARKVQQLHEAKALLVNLKLDWQKRIQDTQDECLLAKNKATEVSSPSSHPHSSVSSHCFTVAIKAPVPSRRTR